VVVVNADAEPLKRHFGYMPLKMILMIPLSITSISALYKETCQDNSKKN